MRSAILTLVLAALWSVSVAAQITPTFTFNTLTTISSTEVNTNFALLANALNRTGGTITGNITVSGGVTIDGIDLSTTLNQNVLTTSTPTFAGLTITGTGASVLDVGGGLNIGTGNVALVTAAGKITAISSTYFDSLDGTNLTGLAKLASTNAFTARNDFKTYTETKATPAIAAGTLTLDLSSATHFVVALNANVTTLAVTNTPASGVTSFTLTLTADGTPRTVDWADISVKWPGGSAPTLTSTNNKQDVIVLFTLDGGTSWHANVAGQSF